MPQVTTLQYLGLAIFTLAYPFLVTYYMARTIRNHESNPEEEREPSATEHVSETPEKLVNAKDAWKSTQVPQLNMLIREINEKREKGESHVYVSDTFIHDTNATMLLAAGYDMHVMYYSHRHGLTYTIDFNENASGRLTFETAEAKQVANLSMASKDNFDIIEKPHF